MTTAMAVRCIGARDLPHVRFLLSGVCQRPLSTSSSFAAGRPESEAPPKSKYKDTVLLPCTTFPMKISPDKITENEQHIQKVAGFAGLYSWQRGQDRHKEYVLHDGPPYANGVPHIGHAVNKIMKDITVRHKLLQGYKVHYIPGWDCHGLPIELKASGGKGQKQRDPLEVRAAARKVAEEAIGKQRAAFERWGVLADWGTTYRTFDPSYITHQLLLFAQLYDMGYIYQDYLPVHYSPHLGTSLAESELEYNPEHISTAIHVALLATSISPQLQEQLRALGLCELHIPVWTTTPWTLPSNQAVCFASDQCYVVVSVNWAGRGGAGRRLALVWAEPLLGELRRIMSGDLEIICSLEGNQLAEMRYRHPLYVRECPLVVGGHVRMDSGSGLVHTAPAHGHEDFLVSLKYQLPVECYVNGDGRYNAGAGQELEGKEVLGEGNEAVLRMLESDEGGGASLLLHRESYKHSYPYDWRSRRPVIVRATSQWFLNTAQLKEKALGCP